MLTILPIACTVAAAMQPAAAHDVPLTGYRTQALGAWTLLVRPDAEADAMRYRRVIAALRFDLDNVERAVPPDALHALETVRIVITPATAARDGLSGRGMCYHESAGWLTSHGLDSAREGVVEICNMDDFLAWRAEQPMMVLHELSHAYHAMLGADRPEIADAYAAARKAGLYHGVGYVLAAEGEKRDAYALTNAKEYFAELSEAYFGRNDYYPFTRPDLKAYDPAGFAAVEKVWGLPASALHRKEP
jgi:hypothetical protein